MEGDDGVNYEGGESWNDNCEYIRIVWYVGVKNNV